MYEREREKSFQPSPQKKRKENQKKRDRSLDVQAADYQPLLTNLLNPQLAGCTRAANIISGG
jgi:hypothetical protein